MINFLNFITIIRGDKIQINNNKGKEKLYFLKNNLKF